MKHSDFQYLYSTSTDMYISIYVVAMSSSQCVNRGRACIVVNRDNFP